jgi:hypothetical protein
MDDALLFSSLCEVKHLLIAHHDPYHSDDQLNELFRDLQLNNLFFFKYEMAREGMEVELP